MELSSPVIDALVPLPIETMTMTAVMPTTMPRIVRNERARFEVSDTIVSLVRSRALMPPPPRRR